MINTDRLQKLAGIVAEAGLDAIALVPGANLRYLTGAAHMQNERPLMLFIPRSGEPAVIIPALETDLFGSHGFQAQQFVWTDADGYDGSFAAALSALNLTSGKTIGVEGLQMRFFEGEALRRHALGSQIVDAQRSIARLRLHKDQAAIAALKKAIEISEEALRRTIEEVQVGMTEKQVATMLENHMLSLGGQGLSFGTLVLAGENSARPHGNTRADYRIQPGDPLLFDFGATYDGYNADITRTFFVGEPSEHYRKVYEAVLRANETGRNAAKAGIMAGEVDERTRQTLVDAGFEPLIQHRTGHGLGMEVHEEPNIVRGNEQVLEPGMVFTIEPGLYDSGAIGVRIEDNVVVTENGCEVLTSFPRDLTVIGNA